MDRLVCGDVGFGKTEVAMRAAFKAVLDKKQVAILAPTTVLVSQHFSSFRERFANWPISIDFLNRFKSRKDEKETLKKLQDGDIDIIAVSSAPSGPRRSGRDRHKGRQSEMCFCKFFRVFGFNLYYVVYK